MGGDEVWLSSSRMTLATSVHRLDVIHSLRMTNFCSISRDVERIYFQMNELTAKRPLGCSTVDNSARDTSKL